MISASGCCQDETGSVRGSGCGWRPDTCSGQPANALQYPRTCRHAPSLSCAGCWGTGGTDRHSAGPRSTWCVGRQHDGSTRQWVSGQDRVFITTASMGPCPSGPSLPPTCPAPSCGPSQATTGAHAAHSTSASFPSALPSWPPRPMPGLGEGGQLSRPGECGPGWHGGGAAADCGSTEWAADCMCLGGPVSGE